MVLSITQLKMIQRKEILQKAALLAVCADVPFLLWQAALMPCASCLTVASLIFLVFFASHEWRIAGWPRIVASVFVLLVAVNVSALAKDAIQPIPIYGASDAKLKVFFSPSCPSCVEVINELARSRQLDQAAFYPVAKAGEDQRYLCKLNCDLEAGEDFLTAFMSCKETAADDRAGWLQQVRFKSSLMINKVALARMGVNQVPLVMGGKVIVAQADSSTTFKALFEDPESEGCSFNKTSICN